MKNWILLLGCFLGAATAATTFGQLPNKNLNLIGSLSYTQNLSDVWGYVDETGIEYALVGTTNGFSVVSLEDPTNPVEVFYTGGFPTVWRDIKVWNDRAYVTNEGGGGLTIVDLRPLPLGNNLPVYNYVGQNVPFNTAHNLYIDNGVAYLFGVDGTPHGALYLDLSDPDNPTEMGSFDQFYGHDGYVRDNTMYIAHIDDGFFGIYDISNMPTTNSLQTRGTPSSTSHNIWPSDDNQYVFTTDEVAAGYIAAYDISDLSNIEEVDRYQSRPGSGVYPHNVHYYNGYLVISYYADGLIILDVTRPSNMVEVGRYDTSPNFSGDQTDGCWGAYPYFPSGRIITTDIQEGLQVFEPDYKRACYIEGTVRDVHTNLPITGVTISEPFGNNPILTDIQGRYKIGLSDPGTYTYNVTKVGSGYFGQSFSETLSRGDLVIRDIYLDNWPLGVDEPLEEVSWSLFPNPSAEGFRLQSTDVSNTAQVVMRNAQGQVVSEATAHLETLYGTELPVGWYSVEVIDRQGRVNRLSWIKIR